MDKSVFRCLSYANPRRCKGYFKDSCRFCFMASTEETVLCDVCGYDIDYWEEKYEDYHNPETGKDICARCRNKIESEEKRVWAFQS